MLKRVLIIVGVGVVVASAAWWVHGRNKARAVHELVLYGNVDIREVNLGLRVPGKLVEVGRDEGDLVKAGEVIARLDDEPFKREVEEYRGQLASASARLEMLEAGNRPEEIAQMRAVVKEREVSYDNAERQFKRQDELLRTKAVAIQDRDDAEARFREAEARLKSAHEQLSLLQAGFRKEEIAQAKADRLRVQALLASAELRQADTILKSPSDGVIITRAQEPGAILQTGTTVLTLSLKEPVWVRAYVQETDLGRLHPGLKVQVFNDSNPNKPYEGQVGYISPRAEFTPKNVETPELRTSLVYRLRIVIRNPDEALRQGMPVTVRFAATPGEHSSQ